MDLLDADEIELPAAFDAHVHLRDGDMSRLVAPTIRKGGVSQVYVMVRRPFALPPSVPPRTSSASLIQLIPTSLLNACSAQPGPARHDGGAMSRVPRAPASHRAWCRVPHVSVPARVDDGGGDSRGEAGGHHGGEELSGGRDDGRWAGRERWCVGSGAQR